MRARMTGGRAGARARRSGQAPGRVPTGGANRWQGYCPRARVRATMSEAPLSPADTSAVLAAVTTLTGRAVERAREITRGGQAIDDHQVLSERVAYAATEARAAREL